MNPAPPGAIVLFAHGARDPEWAEPFRRIVARIRKARPDVRVELAFLEFMQPTLEQSVAALVSAKTAHITLVPLFLAQGGHLKHDLPLMLDDIRRTHPGTHIEVTPAIGDAEALTSAIADWALAEHLSRIS